MGLFGRKKDKEEDNFELKIESKEEQKAVEVRTDKDTQIIKYNGANEEVFEKYSVDHMREDAQVVVPATHNAIIVRDGILMNVLEAGIYDVFPKEGKKGPIDATVDVIFISKTAKLRVLWGTRTQFDFRDPVADVPLKVGANGEFEVGVANAQKFYLELVGADRQFSLDNLKDRLIIRIVSEIEPVIARTMRENNVSFDRMVEYKKDIANAVKPELAKMFEEDYGLKLYSFTLAEVMIREEYIKAITNAIREKQENERQEQERLKSKAEQEQADTLRYEREKEMRQMENQKYDKYLDAVNGVGHFEGETGVAATTAVQDPIEVLAKMKKMLDLGLITQAEYDAKKNDILSKM